MVGVVVRLFDVELRVVGGDVQQFPVDVIPEFGGDDRTTVFGRKDDVVVTEIDAVTEMSIVMWRGHPFIVSHDGDTGCRTSLHPTGLRHGELGGVIRNQFFA